MRTSRLDFSGARNIINPEAKLAKTFGQTGSTIDKMIAQSAAKKQAEEALKQQALQNQMAREGLDLRTAAGQRDADKYARDVAGDEALRTYAQQLGNIDDTISDDAMEVSRQIRKIQGLDMPSGDYDPTKLIAMREKAIAKPQGTLDIIAAAKAAEAERQQALKDKEAERQQALKDKEALAWQKEQWLRSRADKGTITMSMGTPGTADYRVTTVPISQMEPLQKAGWTIGKADLAGSGSGSGGRGKDKDKAFNFTDDVKTNARLGKELTEVASTYGVDERSVQNALNTAKEDQNNFLWWRDISSSLGFDTEPAKQDVLSRIPSGYVNSSGKAVSIADQEGYLKDAGITIFKDMATDKYVNKDATTGTILSQEDVQKRLLNLPKEGATENNETNSTASEGEILPSTPTSSDDSKTRLVEYVNNLRDPNSQEFKDNLDTMLGIVSGGGVKKVAQPAVDAGILKASQVLDKFRGRTSIPGQGFMKTATEKTVGGSGAAMKQEFLKGISDEVAILLSKTNRSPQDVARLKEIANNFPSMKQDILKYLYN